MLHGGKDNLSELVQTQARKGPEDFEE